MGTRYREYLAAGRRIASRNEATNSFASQQQGLQKDLQQVLKTLNKLPKELRAEVRKKVLEQAAQPLVDSAKEKAPQSPREHFDMGAAGGKHKITYYPGNLKKSIRIIPYRKSASVFVGPKIAKKARAKAYGRNDKNVNGFYAGFVEFGTSRAAPRPFMRPAFDASKAQVFRLAATGMEKIVAKYERENKVQ